MKSGMLRRITSCHDAKRTVSVPFASVCAARFIFALRYFFFAFFFPPTPICRNCA